MTRTTGEPRPVQVTGKASMLGAALLLALGGCSSLDSVNPVSWWHNLEGGPIADDRPPPPNADAPYRNLGDAPTDVPKNDAASRGQIANALVADRANAQYDATLAPLPPAPARPAAPGQPKPAATDSSNASLAAATAPPKPSVAKPAPTTSVQSTAIPPPAVLPPVQDKPPAPAALAGVPAVTAPTPPAPTPKAAPPVAAAPVAGNPVSVAFATGSSVLPSSALPGLKTLARGRGAGLIGITGYGEATSATPEAQQAAMPLAMARVRAVAAYLLEQGVPSSALRIDGQAQGSGAVVTPVH